MNVLFVAFARPPGAAVIELLSGELESAGEFLRVDELSWMVRTSLEAREMESLVAEISRDVLVVSAGSAVEERWLLPPEVWQWMQGKTPLL